MVRRFAVGALARFHGGPLAGREQRLGGIGPDHLIVACSRETGAYELGSASDWFDPDEWETTTYACERRADGIVEYVADGWVTEFKKGDRVVTLHEGQWRAGTVERVYSDVAVFAGERHVHPEMYGVRWDNWPRVGNGPDREDYYCEGIEAGDLAADD